MTQHFLHNVELPFSKKQIRYRELSSEDQLFLAKANVLLPSDPEFVNEYASLLTEIISKCLKNPNELYELNFIEYIMFLTKLRIVSVGADIELEFDPQDGEKEIAKKVKVTINLNNLLQKIYNLSLKALNENVIKIENFEIELDWPSLKSQNYFINISKGDKNLNNILDSLCEYVKYIKFNGECINFLNFTHDEKLKIYEKLPIAIQNKLQVTILKMIKDISEESLFDLSKLEEWKFGLYDTNYLEILRLIFSFNLRNIYQEYYILASKKINPEYVNQLSVSERKTFITFVEEEIKAKKEESASPSQQVNPAFGESPELQNLMREFEG